MHEWMDALRFEVEAQAVRASGTPIGAAISSKRKQVDAALAKALKRTGETAAGSRTSDAARKTMRRIGDLPLLSLTAEAACKRNCVDLCAADVREHAKEPICLVQLAEALESARRDRESVRYARALFDPTSWLVGMGMRTASTLGGRATLLDKLVRRVHQLARQQHPSFDNLHALARMYRLAGKPGLAITYAGWAVRVARTQRESLPREEPLGRRLAGAWRRGGLKQAFSTAGEMIGDGIDSLEAGWTGDIDLLDPRLKTIKQEGAAWTTAAWAYRDLGDMESACTIADLAINMGYSCGYEVKAAALDLTQAGWLGKRMQMRQQLLTQSSRIDRAYYRGHWRGDLRASGTIIAGQTEKVARIFERPESRPARE
ncbi:hypothetical protein [Streptomyces cavernae]|uniref:hypothetical protein n=1 Tax=Streptomyces cavernae TaxID=2259034 RepID=UPI000FEBCFE2|nr:hypothetical protein [Streptomyces cavernae]